MASFISRVSASGYQTIFRSLAHRRPPQPRPIKLGPRSRVLCFTCAGIGDTLTDSVVFKALRETFVEAHLAAVVHRRRRLLLEPSLKHSGTRPLSRDALTSIRASSVSMPRVFRSSLIAYPTEHGNVVQSSKRGS